MSESKGVLIIVGSDSDAETMRPAWEMLKDFDVRVEFAVASAHRSPERAALLAREAREKGFGVVIAGAGGAAHLAGTIAANTTLPVIGVAFAATELNGLDALLSTVMMPPGVPVAATGIGKWGAKNAGLTAVRILALGDAGLAEKLEAFKAAQTEESENKNRKVQKLTAKWEEGRKKE